MSLQRNGSNDDPATELNPNKRKVSLKFRQEFRLPPLLTVLRAAHRWEKGLDSNSVRTFNSRSEIHVIFSTAEVAAAAAEGFKGQWARKTLRLPEEEPPIVVDVLEIKPPPADWRHQAADKAK